MQAMPAYVPQAVSVAAAAGYLDRKTGAAMIGGAGDVATVVAQWNALSAASHPTSCSVSMARARAAPCRY